MTPGLGIAGFNIALTLIGIMLLVGGIALGIGFSINDKRLKEFGKDEIMQCVINGVLVGGLILLFSSNGIVSTLINSVVESNNTSFSCPASLTQNAAICFGYDYLVGPHALTYRGSFQSPILDTTTFLLTGLLTVNFLIGSLSAVTLNLGVVSGSLGPALHPILSQIGFAVDAVSGIMVSVYLQASLLVFVAASALSVLLPVGLILRTFYPTRKLGGFFLALTLGLYVVLPLSYVFNAYLSGSVVSQFNSTSVTAITKEIPSASSLITNNSTGTVTLFQLSSSAQGWIGILNSFTNYVFGYIANLVVTTFILPIFSLVITYVSVKELSGILGSDINIPGIRFM